jgi:hypothetical protein
MSIKPRRPDADNWMMPIAAHPRIGDNCIDPHL